MYRIKKGFVLREIGGNYLALPVGKVAESFNGMIHLNFSGALIWKRLESGASQEDLLKLIMDNYEIQEDGARKDIDEFIEIGRSRGIIEGEKYCDEFQL